MLVTIRGTANTDLLADGEERTVEWTDRIRGMVHRSRTAEVVRFHDDEPADEHQADPEPDAPVELPESVNLAELAADEPAEVPAPEPAEPPRSGRGYTAAAWREFLDGQVPPVPYPSDAAKDDLVALWDGRER